jgi:hypothetical protein
MDMFVLSLFEVERKTEPDNAENGKTKTDNPSQNQGINPRHSALFDARQNILYAGLGIRGISNWRCR